MKTARLGLAALLFAGITFAEEFDLVDYSPKKGTVWIKTAAGQDKRSFDSFSAEDQSKITGWLADREFLSGLSINAEKKETKHEDIEGTATDMSYLITLQNSSETTIENVEVTYQIFYECEGTTLADWRDPSRLEQVKKSVAGRYRANLLPSERVTTETDVAKIRNEQVGVNRETDISIIQNRISSDTYKDINEGNIIVFDSAILGRRVEVDLRAARNAKYKIDDRLLGIYLCVSRKNRFGENIVREVEIERIPEKNTWRAYRTQNQPDPFSARKAANEPQIKGAFNLSQESIEKLTASAERGDYKTAYRLYWYHRDKKDFENAERWKQKTRDLIGENLSGDLGAAKVLTLLK